MTPTMSDEPETPQDDPFDLLWARALEAWDDDARHAALLEFALASERLPDLAGKYRALEKDPEKAPQAKKRLDALVTAATAVLASMKTPAPPKSNKVLTFFAAIVCAVLTSWVVWALLHSH